MYMFLIIERRVAFPCPPQSKISVQDLFPACPSGSQGGGIGGGGGGTILIAKAVFSKVWKASHQSHNQVFTIFFFKEEIMFAYLLSLLIIREQICSGNKE